MTLTRRELEQALERVKARYAIVTELLSWAVSGIPAQELAGAIAEEIATELDVACVGVYLRPEDGLGTTLDLAAGRGGDCGILPESIEFCGTVPAVKLADTSANDDLVVIPVSSEGGYVAALLLLTRGALSDDDRRFGYSVANCLTTIAHVHAKARELRHLALHDELTGLPNRLLLREHLARALGRSRRQQSPVACFFIDLDEFKNVNDLHGHASGDAVLQEVALRLSRCVRAGDLAARLAGDEFVVIVEGVALEDVPVVQRRLHEIFAVPVGVGDRLLTISGSIGVAIAGAHSTPDGLLDGADQAMYSVKRRRQSENKQ